MTYDYLLTQDGNNNELFSLEKDISPMNDLYADDGYDNDEKPNLPQIKVDYREFNSFYNMKEWLKQGEYTLPAIYKTLNDGKFYFDDVLFDGNSNDTLVPYVNDAIKGITINSQGQVSRVLSEHMDSCFVQKNEINGHCLNAKVFPDDYENFSFKEFAYFKHYGSIKSLDESRKYKNMIFPLQFANSLITEIIIPEGIQFIASKAFYKCSDLVSVKLPSTLKAIGRGAFKGCTKLKEIYIPESCGVIESSAFMGCSSLSSVTISNGVTEIRDRAFYNTGISSLFLPNSVVQVGVKAFAYCKNLQTVYIGKGVHKKNGDPHTLLNGTAFYKSPINNFYVDKRNENVKTGKNGELMIRYGNEGWMIIKVPYDFKGMYVADPSAKSMIKNLFEYSSIGKERLGIGGNIGTKLTGINFNNINTVPDYLCSGNAYITTLIMPHIHKMGYNPFTGRHINNITIGCEDGDERLENYPITLKKHGVDDNKFDIKNILNFAKDCQFTFLSGDKSLYMDEPLWNEYLSGHYTVLLNNEWQVSSVSNPNEELYEGPYESFSNKGSSGETSMAMMYIDIEGYEYFHFYIRSYAESSYDYVMASKLDADFDIDTESYDSSVVMSHTSGKQNSNTSLNGYTHVVYDNIDKGKHRITIGYRKDSSVNNGDDRGYVLIPKKQTKVTASSSLSYDIILNGFERTSLLGDAYNTYQSVNSEYDYDAIYSYTYTKLRINFSNAPVLQFYAGSSSESEYDFICISNVDEDVEDIMREACENEDTGMVKEREWLFSSIYQYNYLTPNDINTYGVVTIENDGGEHYVDVYYFKDSSSYDGNDRGYIAITSNGFIEDIDFGWEGGRDDEEDDDGILEFDIDNDANSIRSFFYYLRDEEISNFTLYFDGDTYYISDVTYTLGGCEEDEVTGDYGEYAELWQNGRIVYAFGDSGYAYDGATWDDYTENGFC